MTNTSHLRAIIKLGQPGAVQEMVNLDRGTLRPETLGLSLAEARSILAGIEQTVVEQLHSLEC